MRLEVVGSLWGTLEIGERARVVDISQNGALIASSRPAVVNSTQMVQLILDGHEISLQARVRHVSHVFDESDRLAYRIGLEFLEPPPAFLESFA